MNKAALIACGVLTALSFAYVGLSVDWSELLSDRFVLRSQCGDWSADYITLYVVGNYATFAAYMLIGAILGFSLIEKIAGWRSGGGAPLSLVDSGLVISAFALFVPICGIGHVEHGSSMAVVPRYHFWAVWSCFTAIVSWLGAWASWRCRHGLVSAVTPGMARE